MTGVWGDCIWPLRGWDAGTVDTVLRLRRWLGILYLETEGMKCKDCRDCGDDWGLYLETKGMMQWLGRLSGDWWMMTVRLYLEIETMQWPRRLSGDDCEVVIGDWEDDAVTGETVSGDNGDDAVMGEDCGDWTDDKLYLETERMRFCD